MKEMNNPDETAARTTLRIAGVFQEIRDSWVRRLDSYYNQIESLTEGDWIEAQDLSGIIREARLASREAMDGLGNDLSSELIHSSNGIITRYEAERASLQEEINDLRKSLSRALSGNASNIRRENEALRIALVSVPEFKLLQIIQKNRRSTYDQLSDASGLTKAKIREYAKELMSRGYVHLDKNARPHQIVYLSTPWSNSEPDIQSTLETNHPPLQYESRIERS